MSKRILLIVMLLGIVAAGCGRLGTGLPACESPATDPTAATILTLQAVPTADYSPCINSLKLGWDEVEFDVERGLARLEIGRGVSSFLELRLTPSCDIGDAVEVATRYEDIAKYEDVVQVTEEIRVTIVPDGERPRVHALSLAERLEGARIDDRPVVFSVDEDIDHSVLSRVNKALFTDQYVWIIGDLDIDEGTLEMRATPDGEGAHGLEVDDALDRIEDEIDDVQYRGQWFYVFEGGCITYDFDAEGAVATSIVQDAEEAFGFYNNDNLREAGRNAGFDLIGE